MASETMIENMGFIIAFAEGLASFFSTCVIPLLPIYLGYLTGNLQDKAVSKKRTLFFTLCFILGIFVALLVLNMSFTWVSSFFQDASIWFMRIGGILIIALGCIQLGLFKIPFFQRTFHFDVKMSGKRMNPGLAFIMGFTFSFSWTPCIGPALASILVMAQSMGGVMTSMGLVLVYASGFALPFLFLSFGARYVTAFFQKHMYALAVITKVGAILLILMGSLLFFGKLSFLGGGTTNPGSPASIKEESETNQDIVNFTLEDQNGNTVTLSDYKGKVVFLNFWATWCPNCSKEIEDINTLQEDYKDRDDVAILTVVYPSVGDEKSVNGITSFLNEHNVEFPVLFDTKGEVFSKFGIQAFPTLFVIDKDQSVYGYASGALPLDAMKEIMNKALNGIPANE